MSGLRTSTYAPSQAPASPAARRQTAPAWRDPRLVVGIILVTASVLAGAALFGSIFVATSTVAFWWIESGELGNVVTYGGRDFTSYPTAIYGGWFRRIFGFFLGLGFVAYYPTLFLMAAGGSSLSYDSGSDTYTYVWKTDKAWANTCRQLVVTLIDGTSHVANFQFTK